MTRMMTSSWPGLNRSVTELLAQRFAQATWFQRPLRLVQPWGRQGNASIGKQAPRPSSSRCTSKFPTRSQTHVTAERCAARPGPTTGAEDPSSFEGPGDGSGSPAGVALPNLAAAVVRRPGRARRGRQDADDGPRDGPSRARLPLLRAARIGQDVGGEDPRALHRVRERADRASRQHLRELPRDPGRHGARRARDRRGVEPRHR